MLLDSRGGFCLELRRSNSALPAPSLLSTSLDKIGLRAESWGGQHPKSSPLGRFKFILHLLTRYLELFTFFHQSQGQGHLEVSGWWSLTPIAV